MKKFQDLAQLLPRWLNPKALFFGLAVGAVNGYHVAAPCGFCLEGDVQGIVMCLVSGVAIGAALTIFFPKYFPPRLKN